MKYDDYIKEREQLSNREQANYASYEKTIVTLSAAFLAFSVSFLGLFKKSIEPGAKSLVIASPALLICSWVSFASSVLLMLLCFLINAMAHRKEVIKIEDALDDVTALNRKNEWDILAYSLYILSGVTFVLGVVLLLIFCAKNIHIF